VKTLNILQLSHDYEGPFVSICSAYVKALDPRQHEMTTVFVRGETSESVESAVGGGEVMFLELPKGSLRGLKLRTLWKVVTLCRRTRFDVVIAHRYKPIYLAGIASFFSPFRLLLGVVHGHGVLARLGRRLLVTRLRRNIVMVAVSSSVERDLEICCPSLGKEDRLICLPNCIDESTESEILDRETARRALGLDGSTFVFGTIGRLVDMKEHAVLVSAMAHESLSQCKAVILGEGSLRTSLENQARVLGIDDRVLLPGHVDRAFRYLRAFDVFVLSSGVREAFGVVLLEAMLARVPIICTSASAPREVMGDTGVIFDHGDARDLAKKMERVMRMDQAELDALVDAAYQRMQNCYSVASLRNRFWALPMVRALGR
jgi:hypothetical protein